MDPPTHSCRLVKTHLSFPYCVQRAVEAALSSRASLDSPTRSSRLVKTQLSFPLLCSVQWRQHCHLESPWTRPHAPVDWWIPSSLSLYCAAEAALPSGALLDSPTRYCRLVKTQLSFPLLCSMQWRQHCRFESPWTCQHAQFNTLYFQIQTIKQNNKQWIKNYVLQANGIMIIHEVIL